MVHRWVFLFLVAWLESPAPLLFGQGAVTNYDSVVLEVEGTVKTLAAGGANWEELKTGQRLRPGDQVRTGPASRASIRLSNLSVLRVSELMTYELEPPREPGGKPGINIKSGSVYFFSRDRPTEIQFRTPIATGAIRGTEFSVCVASDGRTQVALIDGSVVLSNPLGEVNLTNGEQAVVERGGIPFKTAGIAAINVIQWDLYYPAVIDPLELGLDGNEGRVLNRALAAYRGGNLPKALEEYPTGRVAKSEAERVFLSELLLSVGLVDRAEAQLDPLKGATNRAGRLAGAIKELVAAVKLTEWTGRVKPELASEWLAESYYLQSRLRLTEALAAARQAVNRSPSFAFGWARVAELEFGFGHTGAAVEALNKSLGLAPENAQSFALRGFLRSAQNRIKEALTNFDQAIALDGALANGWLGRGLCRIKRGQVQSGRDDLLVAAAIEPQRALLRSYLGKAFTDSGDDAHAERELMLAHALDPKDPTSWLYSALLKQQENEINPAISDLENAQTNNDNRSVFRSKLLLDQDRAVASANLASVYRDAGMADVSVREAARAVTDDYVNPSTHLFLSDSYYSLLDPTKINLRYDTVWFNELLLANILAPVGAGRLSQQVSQQDYSKLFEADGLGFAGSTDARTDGMYHETASQFGTYGNSSYGIDVDYHHNDGIRVNNSLNDLDMDATIKQQFTSQDTAMFLLQTENYHSGDNFQYYYQTDARLYYKYDEKQDPDLVSTWHHEWGPGMHTLLLLGRLVDNQQFSDQAAPQYFVAEKPSGTIVGITNVPFNVENQNKLKIYSAELQQVCQWERVALIAGGRYQSGEFHTEDQYTHPTGSYAPLFIPSGYTGDTTGLFQRQTAYSYLTIEPLEQLWLTGGLAADEEKFPYTIRTPPVSADEDQRSQLGPKAALVWSPIPEFAIRGIYTRSLGGVSLDESYRLEPTELVGFPQAFRSLISESIVSSQPAPTFDTLGGALDLKFTSRTFAEFQFEHLASDVDEGAGDFVFISGARSAFVSVTPQRLDYNENTTSISLNQLLGDDFVLGASYKYTQSDLKEALPFVPYAQILKAGLQEADGYVLFNHCSGFYSKFEVQWYGQHNAGWTPAEPDVSFAQENIFAGYRFAHRRAELQLGLLNLSGGDYNLNPLTVYQELPRKRVFEASFNFIF